MDFPGKSAGRESAYNVEDHRYVPGSGISPGEGIGCPPQYSWAFLVAETVKNLPAMQETRVRSWSQKDPLEKGMDTHPSILAWRIPQTEEPGGLQFIVSQRVGYD